MDGAGNFSVVLLGSCHVYFFFYSCFFGLERRCGWGVLKTILRVTSIDVGVALFANTMFGDCFQLFQIIDISCRIVVLYTCKLSLCSLLCVSSLLNGSRKLKNNRIHITINETVSAHLTIFLYYPQLKIELIVQFSIRGVIMCLVK